MAGCWISLGILREGELNELASFRVRIALWGNKTSVGWTREVIDQSLDIPAQYLQFVVFTEWILVNDGGRNGLLRITFVVLPSSFSDGFQNPFGGCGGSAVRSVHSQRSASSTPLPSLPLLFGRLSNQLNSSAAWPAKNSKNGVAEKRGGKAHAPATGLRQADRVATRLTQCQHTAGMLNHTIHVLKRPLAWSCSPRANSILRLAKEKAFWFSKCARRALPATPHARKSLRGRYIVAPALYLTPGFSPSPHSNTHTQTKLFPPPLSLPFLLACPHPPRLSGKQP